ncbi:MAG TPA: alcohol dehydrogenase catalytic domain-containing protein [Candidatus Binataceae bacterium]|nr:alcohol dehydrogenase catalytic domain-containing protein [Candidatus Binataceae bacterium]
MQAIAKTRAAFGADVVELPKPHPGENQLLVRIAACGICGSDLHLYEWELGADRMVGKMPFVMGHEPAGEVVEVGRGVSGFKPGDRVALDPFGHCAKCGPCRAGRFHLCAAPTTLSGAFADYTIAPVGNAHLVPSSMDFETAALLEPFGTGLHAVELSSLRAGDSAVIEGPGPIGLSVALSARALGVTSIVITGLTADTGRLDLARSMGFATVCASDRDWIDQARAKLPEGGADALFDASGAIDSPRDLLRRGGEFVEVGWPARDLTSADLRGLFFHGVTWFNSRIRTPETWRRAIAMVASGQIALLPMVTHRYDLSHGIEAFELLRARQGVKALIIPHGQ